MGGVGGYFGGKIARSIKQNNSREHITFIARGEHLQKIKENGLILDTPNGEIVFTPDIATNDIAVIPYPDFVLLCIKSYDLENAVKQLIPKIKKHMDEMPYVDKKGNNQLHNGILYLKGGDLASELSQFKKKVTVWQIKDFFEESFFETKVIVYLPV